MRFSALFFYGFENNLVSQNLRYTDPRYYGVTYQTHISEICDPIAWCNLIASVKPFKSKNRDKIYLDAPNPNLKKGCDRDFFATA